MYLACLEKHIVLNLLSLVPSEVLSIMSNDVRVLVLMSASDMFRSFFIALPS